MDLEIKPPRQLLLENRIGSTDLKQCGWCVYARGSFDSKYDYCIEGYCEIVKFRNRKINWNNKCKLLDASRSEIEGIIKYQNMAIQLHEEAIKERNHYLEILNILEKKSPEQPKLPEDRNDDHFIVDDMVAVWVDSLKQWFFGRVMTVEDGFVTYLLNGAGPNKSPFWGCGYKGPYILLKFEYNFFAQNKNIYDVWSEKSYSIYEENCLDRALIM